jgi:hypothetical protein
MGCCFSQVLVGKSILGFSIQRKGEPLRDSSVTSYHTHKEVTEGGEGALTKVRHRKICGEHAGRNQVAAAVRAATASTCTISPHSSLPSNPHLSQRLSLAVDLALLTFRAGPECQEISTSIGAMFNK